MPDWFTHILIGAILAEILPVRKKSLVLLGAILPDIIPKIVLLRLLVPIPNINFTVLDAFHSPFVIFLVTIIIAPLFRYNYRKVVLWLNIGTLSHLLADSTLTHFTGGVSLFYPFTLQPYSLNLFWPNHSFYFMIPLLIVYITIFITKKKRTKKHAKKKNK